MSLLSMLLKLCKSFVFIWVLYVKAQILDFNSLADYDTRIDEHRQQSVLELRNPFYWAELGELYFNRHRKWKQGGLAESLDCFTWANDLVVSQGGDDARHSVQFAMTLQKGEHTLSTMLIPIIDLKTTSIGKNFI